MVYCIYTRQDSLYLRVSVSVWELLQLIIFFPFNGFVVMFFPFQWFCVPFILMSPASTDITVTAVTKLYQEPWTGRLKLADAGRWLDDLLLVVMST